MSFQGAEGFTALLMMWVWTISADELINTHMLGGVVWCVVHKSVLYYAMCMWLERDEEHYHSGQVHVKSASLQTIISQ